MNTQVFTTDESIDIAMSLYWYARSIWERAGCLEDFCIQHVSFDVVVFGSVNRVIWSLKKGFRIDKSYCTTKFIAGFEAWKQDEGKNV